MGLAVLVAIQGLTMLIFALPTRFLLVRRETPTPARVAVVALGGLAVVAVAFAAFVASRLGSGWDIRCGRDLDVSATFAYWLAIGLGGVALGALAADRVRGGGLRAWHVAAGVAAVLLTFVAIAEVFFAGLSCHGR